MTLNMAWKGSMLCWPVACLCQGCEPPYQQCV